MRRRCPPARLSLVLEELELRLVLSNPNTLTVPVTSPYGDEIVTVQAYNDTSRAAFGIFDTGASAITFSAEDQDRFIDNGNTIPIMIHGGATANGFGGVVTGDVSQPGTILASGLHAASMSFGTEGTPNFS